MSNDQLTPKQSLWLHVQKYTGYFKSLPACHAGWWSPCSLCHTSERTPAFSPGRCCTLHLQSCRYPMPRCPLSSAAKFGPLRFSRCWRRRGKVLKPPWLRRVCRYESVFLCSTYELGAVELWRLQILENPRLLDIRASEQCHRLPSLSNHLCNKSMKQGEGQQKRIFNKIQPHEKSCFLYICEA